MLKCLRATLTVVDCPQLYFCKFCTHVSLRFNLSQQWAIYRSLLRKNEHAFQCVTWTPHGQVLFTKQNQKNLPEIVWAKVVQSLKKSIMVCSLLRKNTSSMSCRCLRFPKKWNWVIWASLKVSTFLQAEGTSRQLSWWRWGTQNCVNCKVHQLSFKTT